MIFIHSYECFSLVSSLPSNNLLTEKYLSVTQLYFLCTYLFHKTFSICMGLCIFHSYNNLRIWKSINLLRKKCQVLIFTFPFYLCLLFPLIKCGLRSFHAVVYQFHLYELLFVTKPYHHGIRTYQCSP